MGFWPCKWWPNVLSLRVALLLLLKKCKYHLIFIWPFANPRLLSFPSLYKELRLGDWWHVFRHLPRNCKFCLFRVEGSPSCSLRLTWDMQHSNQPREPVVSSPCQKRLILPSQSFWDHIFLYSSSIHPCTTLRFCRTHVYFGQGS